ncbi:hypothetical protein [Halosegnis longus]|uniref:hypothetical protein n=1 Tax=Halosegnis longus TaxID=2216012 RepID=UPI00096A404F|nr:hypothetical protein [Salella cibi]
MSARNWKALARVLGVESGSESAVQAKASRLTALFHEHLMRETDAGESADYSTRELARAGSCEDTAARELLHEMSVDDPDRLERLDADRWRFHAPEEE